MNAMKILVRESKNKCRFCILYIVLFSIFFTINVGIVAYFFYYKYTHRNKKCFYILRLCLSNKNLIDELIKWEKQNK